MNQAIVERALKALAEIGAVRPGAPEPAPAIRPEPIPARRTAEANPYAKCMQAALRAICPPDYPEGMIPWLGEARVDLYRELTEILPEEIHYIWSMHAPLEQFEQVLKRLLETHRRSCELYRQHLREKSQGHPGAGPRCPGKRG